MILKFTNVFKGYMKNILILMLLPILVYTKLFYTVFNAIKSKVTVITEKIRVFPYFTFSKETKLNT